jgi:branched-chain amino acid transport system permease protein
VITLQAALSGALLGGLFALMAVGISLSWGMLRIINLAHFGMILLGGYLTLEVARRTGIDPILTIVVTVPVAFAAGAALQWGFQRWLVSEFSSLLVSFGLLIATLQVISNVWSADFQTLGVGLNPYSRQSIPVGPVVFPMPVLLAFLFAFVIVVATQVALERTYPGRALRAFAEDRPIASAFGIDHRRLSVLLAGGAAGTAAVAGMLWTVTGAALTPSTPFEWIGIVFAVVILGGIGNVVGTLAAGMLVGAVWSVVGVVWSPATAPIVVFSLIIAALIFRPRGLFRRGGT